MTAPISLPISMLEDDWLKWVLDVAALNGWMCFHPRPARTGNGWRTASQGHTGFPDVVLARDGDLLVVELKRNGGLLRPDQREWLRHLGPHGCVWRPRDADQVLARLKRGGS